MKGWFVYYGKRVVGPFRTRKAMQRWLAHRPGDWIDGCQYRDDVLEAERPGWMVCMGQPGCLPEVTVVFESFAEARSYALSCKREGLEFGMRVKGNSQAGYRFYYQGYSPLGCELTYLAITDAEEGSKQDD